MNSAILRGIRGTLAQPTASDGRWYFDVIFGSYLHRVVTSLFRNLVVVFSFISGNFNGLLYRLVVNGSLPWSLADLFVDQDGCYIGIGVFLLARGGCSFSSPVALLGKTW